MVVLGKQRWQVSVRSRLARSIEFQTSHGYIVKLVSKYYKNINKKKYFSLWFETVSHILQAVLELLTLLPLSCQCYHHGHPSHLPKEVSEWFFTIMYS